MSSIPDSYTSYKHTRNVELFNAEPRSEEEIERESQHLKKSNIPGRLDYVIQLPRLKLRTDEDYEELQSFVVHRGSERNRILLNRLYIIHEQNQYFYQVIFGLSCLALSNFCVRMIRFDKTK